VQVNGQAIAMHDPRGLSAMGLVYATSPRGACHNQSDMYWVDMGRPIEALGIPTTDRFGIEGKAAITARHQDWRSLGNALIQCTLPNPPVQNVIGMLAAATGWDLDNEKALWLGEGIWNIKRALNLRLGWTRAQEKLPDLLMKPLGEGGTEGNVPDMEILLRDYYDPRGRDWRLSGWRISRSTYTASSLSERCSLAPCGRLISGKIAQKQTKNGHEAYRVLRQAARTTRYCFPTAGTQ